MSSRLHLRIRGTVQGVWYRVNTQRKAKALGLVGWVCNRPDGSVELVAEGADEALDQLQDWCRRGPESATVRALEGNREAATGEFSIFSIRR